MHDFHARGFRVRGSATAYVRFLTPWPEILINFQQGKSQGVRNLAQQLDLDGLPVSLASSETPPPPTPQAFLEA
jgi:hypothetical protein